MHDVHHAPHAAASDANVDINDQIFDWSIMLTDQKREKASAASAILTDEPNYANHRFETFNDVKQVIYQAYKKRVPDKNRKEKAAAALKDKQKKEQAHNRNKKFAADESGKEAVPI